MTTAFSSARICGMMCGPWFYQFFRLINDLSRENRINFTVLIIAVVLTANIIKRMKIIEHYSSPQSSLGSLGTLANKLAVLYLATPVALFAAFWFKPLIAIALIFSLAFAISKIVFGAPERKLTLPRAAQTLTGLFCFAAAISLCLIAFPTSSSIPFDDFAKHQALLHDLTAYPWPVTFFQENASQTVLRYSFAYYLVPAGLAKIFGAPLSQYFLFLWTSFGVLVFFLMVADIAKSCVLGCLFVIAIALFAGLDFPYLLLKGIPLAQLSTGVIDAWSRQFSCGWLIGSNLFSLRWAPQHTVAAFLGATLLHRAFAYRKSLRLSVLTFSLLVLWSPFVAASFGVLSLALLFNSKYKEVIHDVFRWETFAALSSCAAALAFILSDPQGIPSGLCSGNEPLTTLVSEYVVFVAVEFGVFSLVLFACRRKITPLGYASVSLLLVLPFIQVGAASDLQMRGSEIPMCLLAFLAMEALQERKWTAIHAALLIAIVGSMTGGLQELLRGGINKVIDRTSWNQSVFEVNWDRAQNGVNYRIAPQYVAEIPGKVFLSKIISKGHPAFALEQPTINPLNLRWHEFGHANFDLHDFSVQSTEFTDAALYSDEIISLSPGLYRIQIALDWNVKGEQIDGIERAAHVSLFGVRKVINIMNSNATSRTLTVFTQLDGTPVRIAFGLGGWAKGSGYIRVRTMSIARVIANSPVGK
jgi:hypothetical protein